MQQRFEYEFVRLKGHPKRGDHHGVIRDYALQGWRLVQVFAPGAGGLWARADLCELVFERPAVRSTVSERKEDRPLATRARRTESSRSARS